MQFCYGYPDFSYADCLINDLNVSDECKDALRCVGIEYVGDVLDVYARIRLGEGIVRMSLECYSAVFRELIKIEYCPWRAEIEDWLVKWVENN